MLTAINSIRERHIRKRRRGATLLEFVLVLGLLALVAVMILELTSSYAGKLRAKGVADKLTMVTEASKGYIKANYAALQSLAPTTGALVIPVAKTTPTGPVPTGPSGLPSLQSAGFLPEHFVDINAFGQNSALLVRRGAGTSLSAIVTTYGGRQIPDDMLGQAAGIIGALGGYVPQDYVVAADAGQILGSYGGWRTNAATWGPPATRPTTGHLQTTLAFEDGALLADFLYRNDIGIADANAMNTSIDMRENDLNNVDQISAGTSQTVQVVGNMAATIDIYARNAHLTEDVNVGNNVNVGNDVLVDSSVFIGSGTHGVASIPVIDPDGNLYVENFGRFEDKLSAKYLDADTVLYSSSVEHLAQPNNGAPVTTETIRLGDLLPKMVAQYSYMVSDGNYVPKPICRGPNNGRARARIMVYGQTDSWHAKPKVDLNVIMASGPGGTFVGNVGVKDTAVNIASAVLAEDTGSTWRVKWVGDPPSPYGVRRAVAQTFCYYGK